MPSIPAATNLLPTMVSDVLKQGKSFAVGEASSSVEHTDFNAIFTDALSLDEVLKKLNVLFSSGQEMPPELLAELQDLLPVDQLQSLESVLQNGNQMPLAADFAAEDGVNGNPALIQWVTQWLEASGSGPLRSALQDPTRAAVSVAEFRTMLQQNLSGGVDGNVSRESGGGQAAGKQEYTSFLLNLKGEAPADLPQVKSLLIKGEGLQMPTGGQASSSITPFGSLMASAEPLAGPRGEPLSPPAMTIPPGERGWDNVLSNRIMWMVGKQMQQASLQITPRHLGPIDIQVSVQNEMTSVSFTAQNAVVKEALEAAIPRLREMFSENNMQLINVDVGQREQGQPRGEMAFSGQAGGQGGETSGGAPGGGANDDFDDAEHPTVITLSSGLVDDYA